MSRRKPHPVPVPVPPVTDPPPVPVPPVTPAPVPQPPPVTLRRWGVILGDESQGTLANFQAMRAKGVTSVTITAVWEFLQRSMGADVRSSPDWPAFVGRLNAAASVGLAVNLSLGHQYPPQWAKDIIPKFRDATPVANFYSSSVIGADVRDWIWSAIGQQAIADYTTRVIQNLPYPVDSIRLGSGAYGEVCYPRPGRWDGGDVTSVIQPARPAPGPLRDADYLDAQSRFIVWLIGIYRRAGHTGTIHVLHPSFGIRSDWTPASPPYAAEFNAGADPRRYIQAYARIPGVQPYATWLEDTDRAGYPGPDSSKASWRKVLDEASLAGLSCWGENADPNAGQAGMDQVFRAVAAGVAGANWITRETFLPLADYWAGKVAAA